MKKFLFAFATLFFAIPGIYAQDMQSRLDSLMSYYASEYNFNGIALLGSKGNIVFEKSYGYRDIRKKEKHDENSIFQVGSLTSQFTAELVMMLAKDRKLSLEDKLNKYFPKYPKGDSITIRELLNNTSGIMDYFMFDGFFAKHDTMHVSRDTVMALFNTKPPQFTPGTRFHYSNSNYLLLGYIIEKVTHKSYSEVVRERIFKPLGMVHSGFDYRGLKDKHKSHGYRHYTEHEKEMSVMDSTLTGGAASLYTTAADLYTWTKALQSYRFLDKKTQDSMYIPVLRNYGYGWYADTVHGKTAGAMGGMLQGFSSFLVQVPSDELCVILIQNVNLPAFDNSSIAHKMVDAYYDKDFTLPTIAPVVQLSPATLGRYEGEFVFPSAVSLAITVEDSGLHAHNIPPKGFPANAPDFDMLPIGDNKFKTKSLNAVIEFLTDATGNVTGLVMHQPKHDIVAKKKAAK